MDPSITNGTRKTYTEVDFGALADVGWTVSNHAPVLDSSGDTRLLDVGPNLANNPGTLVTTLLATGASSDPITDADTYAMRGIAITAVDTTNGVWQYSTTAVPNWQPVLPLSGGSALLLAADANARLRFLPNAGFNGTMNAAITFRAWDQSVGNSGAVGNASSGGGTSAFSSNVETAALTVIGGNQAPNDIFLLPAVVSESAANGTLVGALSATDPNPGNTATYSLVNNAGGRFALSGSQILVANGALLDYETSSSHDVTVTVTDQGGLSFTKTLAIAVSNRNEVKGRFVFYNNSKFDGNNAAAGAADDAAIAPDKTALLPGGTATFANYTSYSGGINGIMIDLEDAPGTLSAGDFDFRVGNTTTLTTLAPAAKSVTVRSGAGVGGSDRVTIIWDDGAIRGQWLQVTSKVSLNLARSDVFYFGNAIGETGNSAIDAIVDASDEIAARNNTRIFANAATLTTNHDFNRDGFVNAYDEIYARSNRTTVATALQLLTFPAALGLPTNSAASTPSSLLPVMSAPASPATAAPASMPKAKATGPSPLDASAVAAAFAQYGATSPTIASSLLVDPSAARPVRSAASAALVISLRSMLSSSVRR
jgi:hypothetical protein